jgi:hypothetical protein
MEFFDLSPVVKTKQPILDAVKKSLEGKRPQLPAYQLLQKVRYIEYCSDKDYFINHFRVVAYWR